MLVMKNNQIIDINCGLRCVRIVNIIVVKYKNYILLNTGYMVWYGNTYVIILPCISC